MGIHDDYGKRILALAAGSDYSDWRSAEFPIGGGAHARLDGTVGEAIAVEVESRTPKQVRGALLDLVLHPFPSKLVVLIPQHIGNAERTAAMCRHILKQFVPGGTFRVVVTSGSGHDPKDDLDASIVRNALVELGWNAPV